MKLKSVVPALVVLGICCSFVAKLADPPFDELLKRLQDYNKKYPQEKVHLHLDKPYYAIGDDIWFKAYVINTESGAPSNISQALYVELINEKDSIKTQLKQPLSGGISWGDFKLPDTLSEGNYRIRAYTQWMRNAGTEFFFDKTIKIGNSWANRVFTHTDYSYSKENTAEKVTAKIKFADKNGLPYTDSEVNYDLQLNFRSLAKGKATTNAEGEITISYLNTQPALYKSGKIVATINLPDKQKATKSIPLKATSNAVDVQFFPEGGNLVEGLPNKIAVKAVNSSGLGEDVAGLIVDNEGTEVNRFESTHLGMGNFVVNPQPGKVYSAKVKFKDGSEQTFALPKVLPSGYVLSVNSSNPEKIVVKILMSADLIGTSELKLVAQHSGNVYFVTKATSQKQIVTASIPKKDLPSGIIQFTLFNATNNPVAERLAFVNNTEDRIKAGVEKLNPTYSKREKVDISLLSQFAQKPIQGSFSIAVTNTASVKPDPENETNILTSLLLRSDLAGYIEKPNYYFLNNDEKTAQALDNLLMTQGWRRILWKNIINNIPPNIRYQPERSLAISGTITSYGGKPLPNSKVSLFSSSGGFFAIDTLTDAQGRFNFDNLIFNDSTKFIVQGRTAKNKKSVDIKLDIVPGQIVTKNTNTGDIEVNVNEALQAYLKRSNNYFDELTKRGLLERSLMLNEVKIVEKRNDAKNSSNLNGAGRADFIITAEMLQNCVTLSQCLQGRVAGLIIENGIPYLTRNMFSSLSGKVPMQIVLDGMHVEADFLDNIMPNDVESIEVLKSVGNTAIYGSRGGGGVLIITTKRGGGFAGSTFAPGIITFAPKGYHTIREFYSPKYEPGTTDSRPDLRSTVYWNPHVVTDKEGKAAINYFNTDEAGTYRVVIEGIDVMGHLARTVYTYEVK
ncbi:carboxypeptidase-like regulatory domain-containing protein [Pedobacter africanus]|uniref:TonB-dependent outer membrane receptor, SusC/RagA subfamily, signature region n=1 Tax=Pedobacter africanus TaxID=151894 RepID=A0A1W2BHI4_9SPHI|nr:TonB-dependent receptor plug domain-containing protein [Pedobacter africanus]SMC72435.1 TonB-dependent outer membrane receptor, SusC/RagA subfamily, signature region [Pedobacter africanus]